MKYKILKKPERISMPEPTNSEWVAYCTNLTRRDTKRYQDYYKIKSNKGR